MKLNSKNLTQKIVWTGTCMQDLAGHFWGPCLCSRSSGTGNQGHGSGHLVSALYLGPSLHGPPEAHVHHGCPEARAHHAHTWVNVTEAGVLCCHHNCYTGPWETSYQLVQRRFKFRLPLNNNKINGDVVQDRWVEASWNHKFCKQNRIYSMRQNRK